MSRQEAERRAAADLAWSRAQARLILLAARNEGLRLAPRADGTVAVKGGVADPALARLIEEHSRTINEELSRARALAEAVRRVEWVA